MTDIYDEKQRERVERMRRMLDASRSHAQSMATLDRVAAAWERDAANGRPLVLEATPESDGFHFAARAERDEARRLEHDARKRRAEAEVTAQDRVHASLRDWYGIDEADRMMGA